MTAWIVLTSPLWMTAFAHAGAAVMAHFLYVEPRVLS